MIEDFKDWILIKDIQNPSTKVMEYYYNFLFEGISNYKTKYNTYIKTELIQKEKEGLDANEFFNQLYEIVDDLKEMVNELWDKTKQKQKTRITLLEISLTELTLGKYNGTFYSREILEFEDCLKTIQKQCIKKDLVILKDTEYDHYEMKQLVFKLSKLLEDESPYIFLKTLFNDVKIIHDRDALDIFFYNFYDLIKEYAANFLFESHKNEISKWYKEFYEPKDLESLWEIQIKNENWEALIREEFHSLILSIESKLKDKIILWKQRKSLIECAAFCELLYTKKYFVADSTRIKSVNCFAIYKYGVDIKIQLSAGKKVARDNHKKLLEYVFK